MQTKLIAGIVEVPEICREFDINWEKYEAPGGNKWLNYYHTEIKPIFEKSLADAKKELELFNEAHARQNAIRKGLEAAKAIGQMIVELSALPDNGINPARLQQLIEWNAATVQLTKRDLLHRDIFTVDEQHRSVEMIEADIKYMTILQEYFDKDFELDVVLYAMYKVAPKFKAKLFRHAMRLLPVIETNRKLIESSKSFIKEKTFELIKPCIDELDKCYSSLSGSLRKMKKEAAKGKPGFWESVV